ncbi:MAG TPA: zinc dependent phospholipase C family protein [Gemmatimonadaceae bacterium]|nr:zinc dependent phospholipase C family protein [Gemmatimonadaceae bacterium]
MAALGALILIALTPSDAWAWTPGTHILLGEALLKSAELLLPGSLATLLRAFPYDFLYGSIAADTSIAKRYARFGRHCHSWTVGYDILDRARDDALRSFAWGYLAHLAADSVAHNYFVPHQLAISSTSSGVGHSYWESRFESHTGERWPRRAHEVILLDHARSDEHLDRILSPTLFSTPTNRRIFRGMVYVTDNGAWQRVMSLMAQRSRWALRDATVISHLNRSFDFVVDLLANGDTAVPRSLDPSGEAALREAKQLRRAVLTGGGEREVRREAGVRFRLPPAGRDSWTLQLPEPLYVPRQDTDDAALNPALPTTG